MQEKPATLILCGGKSSRMGREKAFIEIGGVPLIERVIAVAREISDELLLIAPDAARFAHLGVPVLTEENPGLGPIEAMRVGLEAMKAPAAWVLACDLPNLEPEPLQAMVPLLKGDAMAVVPREEGRVHPLCALYRRGSATFFDRAINRRERALYHVLETMSVIHADLSHLDARPGFLDNLNTPEDLDRSLKQGGGEHRNQSDE